MDDAIRTQVAATIEALMKANSWSATRLAKEAGVAPSTITRALDPKSSFTPSGSTLNKITLLVARDSNDKFKQIIDLDGQIASARTEFYKKNGSMPVVGDIEAGAWRDTAFNRERPNQTVSILEADWLGRDLVAFKIVGDKTDRDYPDGTIVIVDRKPDLKEGDICIMRRSVHFFGSPKFETTTWNFEVIDGELTGKPRSVGAPELSKIDAPILSRDLDFIGVVVAAYHRIDRNSRASFEFPKKG